MFGLFKKSNESYQNIGLEEFDKLRRQKGTVVLDVRTPKEIALGAIPEHLSINISSSDFKNKISELDKANTYMIYCHSGIRSAKACRIMAKMGFGSLYNFKGGMTAWKARK